MTSTPDWSTATSVPATGVFVLDVNGARHEVTCRPDVPLLYLLRNDFGCRSPRFGCGLGQCGACLILLDDHPTPSCDLPVWAAQGHRVVTLEGLAADRGMRALQQAFIDLQAAQCGYCMSGILVAACALLRSDLTPDRPAVALALERNLCRCGSHGRVVQAVIRAGHALHEQPTAPRGE